MLYIHVYLSRSRLCHNLCPLWACACQSLRPFAYVVTFVPLVDFLGVTTCEIHLLGFGLLDVYYFSTLCDVTLSLLALCHPFGLLCFFASLHACLYVHAWVCVLPILQSIRIMDTWSESTFVLLGHPLLFDNIFVCPHLALSLIVCLLAYFPSSCFFTCLLSCYLCHCMYTLGAWALGARVQPPRCKQKGVRIQERRCKPTRGNV